MRSTDPPLAGQSIEARRLPSDLRTRRRDPRGRRFACGSAVLAAAVAVGATAGPRPATAADWPAWRGPDGTGASADERPPLKWSPTENVRWRVDLPDRGNSTPVVWGDRVFVTQAVDGGRRRTVMCFARADGKLRWQSAVAHDAHEPTNGQNPYCAASPATDGTRVVAYFGSAGVHCYDPDGKELWHRDVGKVDSWHGSGASPVLYRDLCFVNAGPGTNAALLALDKGTGEVVWTVTPPKAGGFGFGGFGRLKPPGGGAAAGDTGRAGFDAAGKAVDMSGAGGFVGSWSTPLVVRVDGRDELVVPLASKLAGYDPRTGKELWTCGGMTEQVFATPTAGEGVLVATGKQMSGGTQVIAVRPGGRGDVTATHRLWQERLPKECVGSPVVHAGRAYLVTQFGSVVCLDLATGKKLGERRLTGDGGIAGSWSSILVAGGKLYVPNQAGDVFVVNPSPALEVLAANGVGGETTCASLALADGNFFIRTYRALWRVGPPAE